MSFLGLLQVLMAVALVGGALLLVGALLPRRRTAASTLDLAASPRRVWELVSDFAEQSAWRPDILEVERLPDVNGRPVWRERRAGRAVTFVVDSARPPRHMTIRIADRDLPFGGSWSFDVTPHGDGARVLLVERCEVHGATRRFLRLLRGAHAETNAYLRALARAVGETAEPRALRPEEIPAAAPAPPPGQRPTARRQPARR